MLRYAIPLLALILVAASCEGKALGPRRNRVRRIVGGELANITDIPYQLDLRRNGVHWCGAVLISPKWALTAGHCLVTCPSFEKLTLLAGSANRTSGGQVREVDECAKHRDYNGVTFAHDIAALRVSEAFDLNDDVRPVTLPSQFEWFNVGTEAVVSGYGNVREGDPAGSISLRRVTVQILDVGRCGTVHNLAQMNVVCAGYWEGVRNSCQGDSGGPLAADGKLIGIVSFSVGCARASLPTVFTRVAAYRTWILNRTGV